MSKMFLKEKYKIKCQYCDKIVERTNNVKKTTCFDCKMEKIRENARLRHFKKTGKKYIPKVDKKGHLIINRN